MSFNEAIAEMAGAATAEQVGLVARWNRDDEKVLTLWSESPDTGVFGPNPTIEARPAMFRPNGSGWRAAERASDPAGYHAEELLIACWDRLLAAVDLREHEVQEVEMVLSKSPCFGDKGSSPLQVVREDVAHTYGAGCAGKLRMFIEAKGREIPWTIEYIALAGANATSYVNLGFSGHRGLMTDEELELDMWRQLHVWYRDTIRPDMLRFADFWAGLARAGYEEVETLKSRLQSDGSLRPEKKKELGRAIGELVKKAKSHQGHSSRLDRDVQDVIDRYRTGARLTSLYQAQQGIQLLQALVNVDVTRRRT